MIITTGIYKGQKIIAPDENITRPTLSKVRMGVFNTLYSIIGNFENKTFLDVFGGSGIMGIEALSRGFSKVTVIEKNKKSAEIIKRNYKKLGITPDLIIGDSLKYLSGTKNTFDVVYIDPPYNNEMLYLNTLELIKNGIIIVEHINNITANNLTIIKEKNYGDKKVTFLLH